MRSPLMHDLSLDSSLEHSLTRPAKQPPRSTTQKVHVLMYESTTLEEFTDEEDVTEQSLPGVRTQDYFQLGLIASALVAAWVFNNVSWIYLSDRAGQTYAFFLDQWTSLLVILMQLPIFLYQWLIAKTIPREELTAIPFLALLLMGSVDAVYDCFVTVGSPYTVSNEHCCGIARAVKPQSADMNRTRLFLISV